ncbi:hypothetical protein KJ969_02385 [Patescibacteria group bacterium]|nr:hypothetical protein [Patescibacteria group bacterium]MBU1921920.1 hypothetical protein [Patescibacteria group bacterium]
MPEKFTPEQFTQTQAEKAESSKQEFGDSISQMPAHEIDSQIEQIENRYREIDKIAGKVDVLEKEYGINASQKMEQEINQLEQKKFMLLKERPCGVARQRVSEIEEQFREIDKIASDPAAMEKKYGPNATEKLEQERSYLEELRREWQIIGQELKNPQVLEKTPVQEPEFKALPSIEITFQEHGKTAPKQMPRVAREIHQWKAMVSEAVLEQDEMEKTKKSKQYKELLKQFEELGQDTNNLPLSVDLSGHFAEFMNKLSRVGKADSAEEHAGQQLYADIMQENVRWPIRDWEWQTDLKKKTKYFDKMLLSDLTGEIKITKTHLKNIEQEIKKLDSEDNFRAPQDKVENLAKQHNLEVTQKINQEYIEAIEQHLKTLDKKALQRTRRISQGAKVKILHAERLFQLDAKLAHFPKIGVPQEEKRAA